MQLASAWGMKASAAASGPEALALLSDHGAFDAGVLAVEMPEAEASQLVQSLARLIAPVAMPMIQITSAGGVESAAASGNFSSVLRRPARPEQLLAALSRLFKSEPLVQRVVSSHPFVPSPPPSRPERLLLAEDNAVNQRVALLMLAKLGFRADVAANGKEVMQAVDRQRYDIILMDVQMPEMDGLETARAIGQRWPDRKQRPRIIAITANAMMGDREACLAAGMDDYVSKPMKTAELSAALERARASLPVL
jgi:CheY-like chemotaxis protein